MNDGEWISITDAAARLSGDGDIVDRSTLSRYLKQHGEALSVRREGKSNLVEFGTLAAHRAENVRLRRTLPLAAPAPAAGSGQGRRIPGSQSDGTARKVNADAAMREMDLAERIGELTLVAEVDKGARDAIALMLSSFERAVDTEAASASVKYGWDERVARLVFKSFTRKGMDVFHREMLKLLDSINRAKMAADQGDVHAVEASLQ